MIRQKEDTLQPWSVAAVVAALMLIAGCGKEPAAPGGGTQATDGVGGPGGTSTGLVTNQIKVVDAAQLAAVANQFTVAQQAQAEQLQRLLNRLAELENKDAERALAGQGLQLAHAEQVKAYEARAEGFVRQIGELEAKVASLQAGRVLPEIALTPDDSPTTRELDQKLRIAERNAELATEATEAHAREQPRLTAGASGFALSSADTNFVLRLRGLVQLDSRTFFDDNPLSQGNDTFVLRRARPILEGTVFRDFDFRLVPDFGGASAQIFDASLNYRYRPELQLQAGKFKGPVGLENLQSDATLPFNERSLVSDLVSSRSVGIQLWGEVQDGLLGYSLGAFNVTGDGRVAGTTDFGDDKEFAGRLFLQPFKKTSLAGLQGLGVGLGGSYSQVSSNALALPGTTGGTLPGYVTSGSQQFFAYNPVNGPVLADGGLWRLSPQISYLWGPFGLLGEYAISHQSVVNGFNSRRAELDHQAWQVSAQWVLTGEPASFMGIIPKRPFGLRSGDGWGAWQLVGRFGQLDIDDAAFPNFSNPTTSAGGATSWSVGVNWWLNRNVRLMTSYLHTTFDGGGAFNPLDPSTLVAPATVTAQDENAFLTRLQLAF